MTFFRSSGFPFHFTFLVHYDSCVVFKHDYGSVFSPPAFPLSNNHSKHDLLSKFWLSLFHTADNHISNRGGWKSIQPAFVSFDGNDVQVLRSGVVAAVDYGGRW